MKPVLLCLLMSSACCCGVLPPQVAYAQDVTDPTSFSSGRFEQWAKELHSRTVRRLGKPEAAQIEPDLLKARDILLERLRQEKWTTDTSIVEVVQAWMEYESPRPNQDGKRGVQGQLFPVTIVSIDQFASFLQDRPLVLSRLYSLKGTFLSFDRKSAEAAEEFEKAASVVTPLALQSELARLGNLLELASLISTTDKEKADVLYRDVLSMPWLFISDEETKSRVRTLQVRAGRGIITLHSGDSKALHSLYSFTSGTPELRPELDAAIKEAEQAQPKGK